MRVTDWLNTVAWLTNISVCCPPQSCGGGTLLDTTKCFHSFHAKKWQNELAILSLQTCMLTALDRALSVYCAHSTINTHCTARNLKIIPAGGKKKLRENFYKFCRSRERQWGAIQYNRWRLCCREHHGMFLVSWGFKWYFEKIISL